MTQLTNDNSSPATVMMEALANLDNPVERDLVKVSDFVIESGSTLIHVQIPEVMHLLAYNVSAFEELKNGMVFTFAVNMPDGRCLVESLFSTMVLKSNAKLYCMG